MSQESIGFQKQEVKEVLVRKLEEIKWIKLKENHRSDLVGKILEYEYGK